MFYALLVQPLVSIFQYIYLALVKLTGTPGGALILLSVVVNIILRPLSAWASRIQDRERRIQSILAPQIAEIKAEHHGAEQHAQLRELYRRYAYNPLYALRSGLDLFIQLLPLSAAYIMLSSLDILRGQPFWGIADLSRPDGLLRGVNLLPLLMTGINFLATLTAAKFSRRERGQAFVIAILFLVLLYDAPSALLVYWTMNNLIMLLKNFDWGRLFRLDRAADVLSRRFVPTGRGALGLNTLIAVLSFGIFCGYLYFFRKGFNLLREALISGQNSVIVLYSCAALFSLCAFIFTFFIVLTLFTKFLSGEFFVVELISKAAYLVGGAMLVLFYWKYLFPQGDAEFGRRTLRMFYVVLIVYFSLGFLILLPFRRVVAWGRRLSEDCKSSLFFVSIISLLFFACLFYPSLLYSTDPSFFPENMPALLRKTCAYGMSILWVSLFFWLLLPKGLRGIISAIAAFVACVTFINAFILTRHQGTLDTLAASISPLGWDTLLKDFFSITIAFSLVSLCIWKKSVRHLILGFCLISLALVGAGGYYGIAVREDHHVKQVDASYSQWEPEFPKYHDRLWRFSRRGKNVVGLFLDAFTGDHLQRLLDEEPDLAKKLDGFVYFPDTISTGSVTMLSAPGIYGGPAYRTDRSNPIMNEDLFAQALVVLPNAFAGQGYDVVVANVSYFKEEYFMKYVEYPDSILALEEDFGKDYVPYWLRWAKGNGILVDFSDAAQQQGDISPFVMVLSLFRMAPFGLRPYIYNGGAWIGGVFNRVLGTHLATNFISRLAPLQFMGNFAIIDDGVPAFKMITSMLPHPSWHLPRNTLQPVPDPSSQGGEDSTFAKGVNLKHYYTERHTIHFLVDFITSLKNLGVYDNTRIVIFSDHSSYDSIKSNFFGTNASALLGVKDFDMRGPLYVSNALMSTEDVPTFLLEGIKKVEGIPDMEELKRISGQDRVRVHCMFASHPPRPAPFEFSGVYHIKGPMSEKANWTKVK